MPAIGWRSSSASRLHACATSNMYNARYLFEFFRRTVGFPWQLVHKYPFPHILWKYLFIRQSTVNARQGLTPWYHLPVKNDALTLVCIHASITMHDDRPRPVYYEHEDDHHQYMTTAVMITRHWPEVPETSLHYYRILLKRFKIYTWINLLLYART